MINPRREHSAKYWKYIQGLRDLGITGDQFNKLAAEWRAKHPEDQPGPIMAARIKMAHERNLKNWPELKETP